jgi:hypothetical protein
MGMFGYDEEAIYQDADIEQMEMEQLGNRIARLKEQGVCTHGSGVTRSKTGEVFSPEQEGLVGEQSACTEGCGKVFDTFEDQMAAHRDVIDGY